MTAELVRGLLRPRTEATQVNEADTGREDSPALDLVIAWRRTQLIAQLATNTGKNLRQSAHALELLQVALLPLGRRSPRAAEPR